MQDRNSTTNQNYRQTIYQATNQNDVYREFTCPVCGQHWDSNFAVSTTDGRNICINCFGNIVDKQKKFYNRVESFMLLALFLLIFCIALCFFMKIQFKIPVIFIIIWVCTCPLSLFSLSQGNDGNLPIRANSPFMAFIIAPIIFLMSFKAQRNRKKMIAQNDKVISTFRKKYQSPRTKIR